MVWFQCEDCGENLKKPKLKKHFSICSATELSCIDCGNMFEQDSVQWHTQCITEAEKYGPKKLSNGTPSNSKEYWKQENDDFDINVAALSNRPSWVCSLCNAKATSENDFFAHVRGWKHREKANGFDAKQRKQFEVPTICKENSFQLPDFDITVGLSMQYPWFCSLCNTDATSQQDLLNHANGKKHRAKAKGVHAKQEQRQAENSTLNKDTSKQRTEVDINVGLSVCYPWFCSLCNITATSQQSLLSHANGKKHRENVEWFNGNQLQQSEQSMMDTAENAYNGDSEQTKVDLHVPSGVANGYYTQPDKKRKLETIDETWNMEAVQAEGAEGEGEKKSKPKKAKKQDNEKKGKKKQTESDSDFEYDKEDMKRLLVKKAKKQDHEKKGKKKQTESDTDFEHDKEDMKLQLVKKAKKQDHEKTGKKKQTESDSDFEYDKEDMKRLLASYSKEELVYLIYKTAEKGSRLMSTILESAERDISQRNIFVRGFGWDTTHEYLKAAFESYGEIEKCSVVMDKDTRRSKGYGFVLFKTRKGAREALKKPEKRMYNRIVVCNLASAKPCAGGKENDMVEPVKIDLTQSDVALPGTELFHRHVFDQRQQQPTMDMYGQSMPFYGHSQPPGFDPMYGALMGNQMVAGPPNYSMFGSGPMNQEPVVPSNHVGMSGQYYGDPERSYWYQR
ncbi:hypothetical protein AALP_AA3G357400 [Arabis alpina]|uniref:RRM domain-containing protein n=1 Tax=Arabis alpina TaxID=50452 RepID=A0A087HDV0_ARAAL|nr:hypothetical protein AALP_AA3G357400 [Arabis alpina]